MFALRKQLASTTLFVLLGILLAAAPGCSTAPSRTSADRAMDLEKIGLRELWVRKITLLPSEKVVHAWRVGDSVYVTTSDSQVARINATSGVLAWQIDLGNSQLEIFRPADVPNSKNVLVVNRGNAYLIDKTTGDIVKQNHIPFAVSTDPIVSPNGLLFSVGSVAYYHAMYIDILGGDKWKTPAPHDAVVSRPAVEGDTLIIATEGGLLWRVSVVDGEWTLKDHRVNGTVIGGVASDGHAFYVPCLGDNNLYAFDITNGMLLWTRYLEGRLDRNLITTRSDVLALSTGKGLYCVNSARGDIKWIVPGITEVGTIVRDRIWVSDAAGRISSLSVDTGETLSNTDCGANVIYNTVDQLVLMINARGEVAAYTRNK